MSVLYTSEFYDEHRSGSRRSAEQIAPLLVDLFHPHSVLDIGCGAGTWLAALKRLGVQVVHGIDGPWVTGQLEIDRKEFTSHDFSTAALPYSVKLPSRKYDLVLCLEFLEHLDQELAGPLVTFLCKAADVVVASAAVPGQGGTHHVNEQWPQYWATLFRDRGFLPCDILRPAIWSLPGIEPWYAQNMIVYFKERIPEQVLERGRPMLLQAILEPRALVHPEIFSWQFEA
jgi:SAM-dependent methyltransferase